MLSHQVKLEVKIGERTYQFVCGNDSPVGEVHDALASMKSFVVQRIQDADKAPDEPKQEGAENG
jgi:hypothetical protein